MKYQWRVLQLLPGAERPSYSGLRVDVLERANGELMIRYQGEAVDYEDGPPSSALWAAARACSPGPEHQEGADDMVKSHLNEAHLERLAALESSESFDDDEANDEDVATRVRGGKRKPVRHKLHRTPTETQQARWEAVQQAKKQGLSLRAIARKLGMDRNTAGKYALAATPPTKKLSAKERARAEALAESPTTADLTG